MPMSPAHNTQVCTRRLW